MHSLKRKNRCVAVCTDDGKCWSPCDSTAFTPSPPIKDISDQCDQVKLTIKVPVKLPGPPKLLMAFLYKVEDWDLFRPADDRMVELRTIKSLIPTLILTNPWN